MPILEAPSVELGSAPRTPSIVASPSPSEISSASSPEPQNIRATPLFRALALPPPEPEQPPGQDELERRLPGYRRIVIPRELTLIELLKQCSGVSTDEEVLRIREAKLRVVAERVGLRRLNVLAPMLRSLTLDGSALLSLRDLGIGLVHLKILSVSRCGLTSLDGIWGLSALRELYAAGNRLRDPQPLSVLHKLHTLSLADNPIEESSRLWMLSICKSLRRLTLRGSPLSDLVDYRSRVASALPMLIYLDERPLHQDVNDDFESFLEDIGSESQDSDEEIKILNNDATASITIPQPGPSSSQETELSPVFSGVQKVSFGEGEKALCRRRPATTENAGIRPGKVQLPPRPHTALQRHIDAPTRLQILNTLMDEEWRCSGSKLTSQGAVCGNLTRALRRPSKENQNVLAAQEVEMVEQTMEEACRALAAEIPRAPSLEEWTRFKQETGSRRACKPHGVEWSLPPMESCTQPQARHSALLEIVYGCAATPDADGHLVIEIDIDFNARPQGVDPSKAIARLEQIEKETSERLSRNEITADHCSYSMNKGNMSFMTDSDLWPGLETLTAVSNVYSEVDTFSDVSATRSMDTNELTCDEMPE